MTAIAHTEKQGISEQEYFRLVAHYEPLQVEVVNGEVVVSKMAAYVNHGLFSRNVFRVLDRFVVEHKLGEVLSDSVTYKLDITSPGLTYTRLPDVSFVRKERLPQTLDQLFPGAPDLAIEIVSPTEGEAITLAKVRDYLRFGTEEVWVLYPSELEVHSYKRDDPKTIRVYKDDDILTAPTLLPGFEVTVNQFFLLPASG